MSTRYGWQPYDDANDDDEHDEHAACISMGGMVGRCRWSQLEEISEIHLGTAGGSIAVPSFAVWRWRERERKSFTLLFGFDSWAPALFDVSISEFYERKPDLQLLLAIYNKQHTKTYHETT